MTTIKSILVSKRLWLVIVPAVVIAILSQLKDLNIGGGQVAVLLAILTAITKAVDINNQNNNQ